MSHGAELERARRRAFVIFARFAASSPDMNERTKRLESAAPWVAGLALAAPVLVAYYPPMTDIAFHEAAIGILRHFDDASMFPPGLYVRNLGQPNQLFYFVGWALSQFVSTRWAVKLVVAAAVVAVPVSAARFARHVGASPAAALVVAPMALGWLFSWGLITNLIGLAVLLAVLPSLDRFAGAPTPRRTLAACAAVLILYLAHEAMLFVYAGVALGLAILHPWSWRKTAWRLAPFFAGIGVAVGQAKLQERFMSPAVRAMPRAWHPLIHKLARISYIVVPASEGAAQYSMLALCLLTIALLLWLRGRERRAARSALAESLSLLERLRERALAYRWEIFAAACFAAYLAFPATLNGATLVYQRWFPPAFAIFAIAAAPRDLWTREGRLSVIAVAALPIATLFVAVPSFVDSDREYRLLEQVIPAVELGSAVAELNLSGDPARTYSLGPAAGRILATRGGRLAYAFTDSPASPAIIPGRYQWNESLVRLGFDCWAFEPARDFKRFRYVLVHASDPEVMQVVSFALQREGQYVTEAGDWALFRSRLPVEPLLSRDAPAETPRAETLRERLHGYYAQFGNPAGGRAFVKPPPDQGGAPQGDTPEP
jgi:hypothetical protein